MQTKQKSRWWLNAALFAGLILACFVDLTGVSLHQWIGIIAGAAALYHLNAHIDWVEAAGQRFFGRIAPRARAYFLIDATLLAGFFIMIGTGLVISTWLNLSLTNYAAWRSVHIAATIATLIVTGVKIILHRNWILQVARKWVFSPSASAAAIAPPALARRDFLGLMGVVGAATLLALAQTVRGMQESTGAESETLASTEPQLPTPSSSTAVITAAATASSDTGAASTAVAPTSDLTAPATAASSAAAATTPSSKTAGSANACTVQCGKRCSFPGRCRRYTDTNGNNLCDLGECL